MEIDSILVIRGSPTPLITNTRFYRLREVGGTRVVPVNFKKGTVIIKPFDIDFTGDGILNLYDLAVAINCVYLGTGNCPGVSTPEDFTKLVNAVFSTNFTAPAVNPVENPGRNREAEK